MLLRIIILKHNIYKVFVTTKHKTFVRARNFFRHQFNSLLRKMIYSNIKRTAEKTMCSPFCEHVPHREDYFIYRKAITKKNIVPTKKFYRFQV